MRAVLPVAGALVSVPGAGRLLAGALARIRLRARERPRTSSFARARATWPSGEVRQGWLRAGDGMDFTAAAVAEVAHRLLHGQGRPGAHTPAALFGPELAEAAGGTFVDGPVS